MAELLALAPEPLAELVARNVAIKAAVVMEDEKETGVRAHLNLGHTFGHAIEASVGYGRILHGEAVGLGLLAAATLAAGVGVGPRELRGEVEAVVGAAGLPRARRACPTTRGCSRRWRSTRRSPRARIRFVLPERIGKVVIRDDVPARGDPRRLGDDSGGRIVRLDRAVVVGGARAVRAGV